MKRKYFASEFLLSPCSSSTLLRWDVACGLRRGFASGRMHAEIATNPEGTYISVAAQYHNNITLPHAHCAPGVFYELQGKMGNAMWSYEAIVIRDTALPFLESKLKCNETSRIELDIILHCSFDHRRQSRRWRW